MDRPKQYTEEQLRSFDVLNSYKDAMIGLSRVAQMILGSGQAVASGFSIAAQSTPNMTLNLALGNILQNAPTDATPYGTLAADSNTILQHGYTPAQVLSFDTTRLIAGQSQYAVVQVQFQQSDIVRPGDPDGGIPAFYNSLNPTVPLQGEDGLGGILPTVRQGIANINIIYGTPATTGSQTIPSASTGFIPLWAVNLTFGMSAITSAQISQHPSAVFLAGLENSHHGGVPGQAPPIDLTKEVQNILPLANAPGSSAATSGFFSTERMNGVNGFAITGNPNGHIAGAVGDTYIDSVAVTAWRCTTAGNSSTAVWTQLGAGLATIISSFGSPVVLAGSGDYVLNATGAGSGSQTVTLPSSAGPCRIVRKDSNSGFALTIQGPSGIPILTGNLTLYNQGEAVSFMTDGSNYYRVS